jgi:hypothetical protein
MPTPPYPLHPGPMRRSWLERRPLWKIPLGCLTLLFLIALFGLLTMTIITASFRSSDVYKQALAKAGDNEQVRDLMGEPIRPAWLSSGDLHVNGNTGDANLSIPISGPRGKGVIRAVAFKSEGVWRFTYLKVKVEAQGESIDLLSVQPPAERDF